MTLGERTNGGMTWEVRSEENPRPRIQHIWGRPLTRKTWPFLRHCLPAALSHCNRTSGLGHSERKLFRNEAQTSNVTSGANHRHAQITGRGPSRIICAYVTDVIDWPNLLWSIWGSVF